MKNLIRWMLASLIIGGFLTVVSHAEEIIHIATEDYAPYTSEKLKHYGIDAHIVTEAFLLEGIKVKYHFFSGSRSYEMAKNGEIDGTLPWAKRKGREEIFYYSDPVIEKGIEHFYYLKDLEFKWDSQKRNYSDLKGMKIGAITSHNYGEKFQNAEKAGIIIVERVRTLNQNFQKLLRGRIQLVISQNKVAIDILGDHFTKEEGKLIEHRPENSGSVGYDYLLFPKRNEISKYYLKAFNKGVKRLKASGRYQRFLRDWGEGKYIMR